MMSASAARMIAMSMFASAHSVVTRNVNRLLQMISVHRVIILFLAIERNELDGDEGGKKAAGEKPAQREPKSIKRIKNLLAAYCRHVVQDVPHRTAFTDIRLHGSQDLT